MRRCYICGRESSRRRISEPLLLPVCLDRECGTRAAALPVTHCVGRLPGGSICGAPAVAPIEAGDLLLCMTHLQGWLDEQPVSR